MSPIPYGIFIEGGSQNRLQSYLVIKSHLGMSVKSVNNVYFMRRLRIMYTSTCKNNWCEGHRWFNAFILERFLIWWPMTMTSPCRIQCTCIYVWLSCKVIIFAWHFILHLKIHKNQPLFPGFHIRIEIIIPQQHNIPYYWRQEKDQPQQ